MQRVNPEGCLLRSLDLKTLNVLQRRKYQVYGPLALWHIDGNHKLIRYERWVICCWAIKRWANVTSAKTVLLHWCKVIQDSLGLWIPRCGFRIEDPGFWIPPQWSLDPDSNRWQIMDSLSWILDSKAHDSGLYQQKFSGFQILTGPWHLSLSHTKTCFFPQQFSYLTSETYTLYAIIPK